MENPFKELENRYSTADDEQLLRIIHADDYTDLAKSVAFRVLEARGIGEATIAEWRDPIAREHAKFWTSNLTASKVQDSFVRRRTLYACILGLLISNLCLAFWWVTTAAIESTRAALAVALVAFIVFNLFAWRTPARILVLRPYNDRHSPGSVRKLIKRYLRFHGHVYTLADTKLNKNWSILHFLALSGFGLWLALLAREKRVDYSAQVEKLKRSINRRLWRNIRWLLSVDKVFKIRAADTCWKPTIQMLANSSDLILLDLSRSGPGIIWETGEIRYYGLGHKTIALANHESRATAEDFLATNWSGEDRPLLSLYDNSGRVEDEVKFICHLHMIIAGGSANTFARADGCAAA